MTIKQNLVPASKYSLKCPYAMTPIGLCVHNTANDASAKNEISYMVTNTTQASFHLAVDDVEVWQGLPLDRNGWHAGDGANGQGNRKHIGIEICYSKSGGVKFTKAESNAIDLIVKLLKERNWTTAQVKKHQDFSGKYCPHRTLDLGWQRFLNIIQSKLGGSMSSPDDISIPKKTFEELVTKASKFDQFASSGFTSATQIEQEIAQLKKSASDAQSAKKTEAERAESARKELNSLIATCAKALNTQQEITQIEASLRALDKQLDELDDLQRQYASLQLESGKQAEELRAEIARLEALIKASDSLAGATFEQLLAEFVRRIKSIMQGRNV